jgi:hypothetical protein
LSIGLSILCSSLRGRHFANILWNCGYLDPVACDCQMNAESARCFVLSH